MIENVKSSIFDFICNTKKVNWYHLKYCIVNNNYPQQGNHQRLLTVMINIFLLSESQNNMSTKAIRFCISLTVTGHYRVSDSDSFTTTIKFFASSSTLCKSEP